MYTCALCRFEIELDDIAVTGPHGRCVCLRCYSRHTETEKPTSKELRLWLQQALAGLP